MLDLPIDQITIDFILKLPYSELCETEKLDYKREVHHKFPSLHKIVCAFANTAGGDVIIGVAEGDGDRKGYPDKLIGIDHGGKSPDEISQMYINTCLTGVEPKPNVSAKCLRLESGKDVVIVRVVRSAFAPHRTKTSRFYRRVGTQSVEMDITDIRNSFNSGSYLDSKIESWRETRFNAAMNLFSHPFVMFNIMPTDSLFSRISIDLSDRERFLTPNGHCSQCRPDMYGRLAVDNDGAGPISYMHISRNGCLDFGFRIVINKGSQLWWKKYDRWLTDGFDHAIKLLTHYGIQVPAKMTGLMNDVSDLTIAPSYGYSSSCKLGLYTFPLDLIHINDWSIESNQLIRPMLDQIWNGFGIEHCGSYHESGVV